MSTETHLKVDMEYDRRLLEDVLDSPDLRYVSLFMFIIRKEVFNDLEDDDLQDQFERLLSLEEITVGDMRRICDESFLKSMFTFNMVMNIKSYEAFITKSESNKVRLAEGIKLEHESKSEEEEEVHIFMNEVFLERIIASKIPEITQTRIHTALERLRAMMCPRTPVIHQLVHKYGDFYVIDDSFYAILEAAGNPYQALRLELLIRTIAQKYKEMNEQINEVLEQFGADLYKADMINKFKTAREKQKTDYLQYLQDKSRKLPQKFKPKFKEDKIPEIYQKWKKILNELVSLKLDFDTIDAKLDKLRAYYSGKKQVMPYLKFIEKTTYDEDNIAETIKSMLLEARNALKVINDKLDEYPKKEMKLLNMDVERAVFELAEEEEDE